MVMVPATLCDRFVNVARPEDAVAVTVPCSVPVPARRVAVTTVLLSEITRLPPTSRTSTTGCGENAAAAVGAGSGCVMMASCVGAPTAVTIAALVPVRVDGACASAPVTVAEFPAVVVGVKVTVATPTLVVSDVGLPNEPPAPPADQV